MNPGDKITVTLAAGHVLTLTNPSGSTGTITRLADSAGGEPFSPVAIAGVDLVFGPFASSRRYAISVVKGVVTYATAPADPVSEEEGTTAYATTAQGALADTALQPADVGTAAAEDVGFFATAAQGATADAAVATATLVALLTSGAGVPDDAVQATLSRNPAGDDNALTFTAVAYGTGGNSITIEYLDPSANDAALSIDVVGNAITVNLATGGAGAITSTAAAVLAAIEASGPAAALVTVAIDTGDTGIADDGSGVVTALASAPMTGGAGTSIGVSLKGGLYVDTTGGLVYRNSGTQAVPAWTALADVVI